MDGTLLDLHYDNYFWLEYLPSYLAEQRQQSIDDCRLELEQLSEQVIGTLDWYCLDYWSEQLAIDIPKIKLNISDRIAFRPHTIAFLDSLRQRKKRIILATNAHPKTLELKLLQADFSGYFEAMSSSHDLGFPKENQAYWPKLINQFGLNPKRCLFIDDSFAVLESARGFGIGHILAVEQPDLTKKARDCSPFTGITDFSQLI
jgi:5'-nucleotidase